MPFYVKDGTVIFGSPPQRRNAARATEQAVELRKPAMAPAQIDDKKHNPPQIPHHKKKLCDKSVNKVNRQDVNSMIPSSGANVLNKKPAVSENFKTTQDKAEFSSMSPVKLTSPTGCIQSEDLGALQTSSYPMTITCPLDHIFGKKKPDPKLPTDKTSPVKNDDKKCEISPAGRMSKSHLTSPRIVATSTNSAKTRGRGPPWKYWHPYPQDNRYRNRPTPKLSANESFSIKNPRKSRVPFSSHTVQFHQPSAPPKSTSSTSDNLTTIQKWDMTFPPLPPVKAAIHNKTIATMKKEAEKRKGPQSTLAPQPTLAPQSTLVPQKTSSTKSPVVAPHTQPSVVTKEPTISKVRGVEPKTLEVESRMKNDDFHKGSVLAELTVAEELPSIIKTSTEKSAVTDRKHLSILEPVESKSPDVSEKRKLSLKEFKKKQKVLRKASQQVKRSAKLEQEKVDSEQVEQEASQAAEQAVIKTATQQDVLKDLLGQTEGIKEPSVPGSICGNLDVMNNPIIAREGCDPMAFVWSRSEDQMEPEYPRSDTISTHTISETGSSSMAGVWNSNSIDDTPPLSPYDALSPDYPLSPDDPLSPYASLSPDYPLSTDDPLSPDYPLSLDYPLSPDYPLSLDDPLSPYASPATQHGEEKE